MMVLGAMLVVKVILVVRVIVMVIEVLVVIIVVLNSGHCYRTRIRVLIIILCNISQM